MSEASNKFKYTSVTVLSIAIIMAVIRIALLTDNVEINGSYTEKYYLISVNTFTIAFSVAVALFAVITIIWCAAFLPKSASVFEPLKTGFVIDISVYPSTFLFTSTLVGFMLLSSGVYFVYLIAFEGMYSVWKCIFSVLMILSSIGFLFSALVSKGRAISQRAAWFKLIPVVFGAYWLMYDFIEQNQYAINSSCVFHILGLVFLMLFFAHEAQNAVGKLRPRIYCIVSLLAVFFMILDALPNLILSCFWMLNLNVRVLLDALELVLSVYIFSKVFSMSSVEQQPVRG